MKKKVATKDATVRIERVVVVTRPFTVNSPSVPRSENMSAKSVKVGTRGASKGGGAARRRA